MQESTIQAKGDNSNGGKNLGNCYREAQLIINEYLEHSSNAALPSEIENALIGWIAIHCISCSQKIHSQELSPSTFSAFTGALSLSHAVQDFVTREENSLILARKIQLDPTRIPREDLSIINNVLVKKIDAIIKDSFAHKKKATEALTSTPSFAQCFDEALRMVAQQVDAHNAILPSETRRPFLPRSLKNPKLPLEIVKPLLEFVSLRYVAFNNDLRYAGLPQEIFVGSRIRLEQAIEEYLLYKKHPLHIVPQKRQIGSSLEQNISRWVKEGIPEAGKAK